MNFSELRDLSASALAVLIATLRTACSRGLCDPLAGYVPPRSPTLRECLDPDRLAAQLESPSDISANDGDGSRFSGCAAFCNHEEIERAVAAGLKWLKLWSDDEQIETSLAVEAIIWDLTVNVLQHADIDGGVVALKLRPDWDELEIAVADRGIGIRRSLAKNSAFEGLADDSAAVSTALAPGRTSTPGMARGTGLYVSKLMLTDNGGTLTVRSGRARISIPAHEEDANALEDFDGTLITAIARMDKPLDLHVVIESLERIGGLPSLPQPQPAD